MIGQQYVSELPIAGNNQSLNALLGATSALVEGEGEGGGEGVKRTRAGRRETADCMSQEW